MQKLPLQCKILALQYFFMLFRRLKMSSALSLQQRILMNPFWATVWTYGHKFTRCFSHSWTSLTDDCASISIEGTAQVARHAWLLPYWPTDFVHFNSNWLVLCTNTSGDLNTHLSSCSLYIHSHVRCTSDPQPSVIGIMLFTHIKICASFKSFSVYEIQNSRARTNKIWCIRHRLAAKYVVWLYRSEGGHVHASQIPWKLGFQEPITCMIVERLSKFTSHFPGSKLGRCQNNSGYSLVPTCNDLDLQKLLVDLEIHNFACLYFYVAL